MSTRKSARRIALAAVAVALLSALFFTCTYVLNRLAATGGGHWAWLAALRYLITLPIMLLVMPWQGGIAPVWRAIRAHPAPWLLCSGIGFVLFYLLLSFAAASGPSWLIAGTFQLTVIAGMLWSPLLYRDARARIPLPALAAGSVVVSGVLLMQIGHSGGHLGRDAWLALIAVAISAFAYPLGNRSLLLHLERAGIELNATQRVFGMTLASQPLWWAVAAYAFSAHGAPPVGQVLSAAGVAVGAGVIATVLFFQATGAVRNDPTALAAVEAMQAAEILFATLIGVLWLGEAWPQGITLWGALVVIVGIVAFSIVAARAAAGDHHATQELRSDRGA
ncbi:MAG TPA: multidrug resistance efflux transporter family protein [Lysobacter sp.]|nr:multidrug resistance efflux transporter family protein [Lysobacter sp.]